MRLTKVAHFLDRMITRISRGANLVGVGFLALMMCVTVADVIGRYIFNSPILGIVEISEFMMVIVVFLAAAYTQIMKGHVRVELLVFRLQEGIQAVIWSTTFFLSLCLFSAIAWQSVLNAKSVMLLHRVSPQLSISIWPFVLVVAVSSALIALVFLADLVKSLSRVVRK